MFRRLAEAFQNDDNSKYMRQQNVYFNTLPNMIPSGTSGLKGFDKAIQSVNSIASGYEQPAIKNPNDIFIQDSSPNLNSLAQQCSSSSIDELIAIKNPNAAIGCGWLYTPPNPGSPSPNLSKGAIGNSNGPLPNFGSPEYKKWFFDLQLAKKQILMDKCKALKACSDVDSDTYNGVCGYCTDTNQGVPIDTVGQPLYAGDPLGSCSPQSIVTSSINCPAPAGTGPGPQPIIDKTCVPTNGRLSADCLYSKLLSAGCSDNGALAIALANPSSPSNYIGSITDGSAVKIYNRVANPPLNLSVFNQGAVTTDVVLQEARQLAGNAAKPVNTALGAAARDLCLQKGTIDSFDFCSDLADSTPPPFDIGCLQKLFRKMGGQPAGLSYPSQTNIQNYNAMVNLAAVKQYLNQLVGGLSSNDYNTQRSSMIQFLGISPEMMIKRPPYNQGIEVFWFVPIPGNPTKIIGFLRRTIETNFVQFGGSLSSPTGIIPQIGLSQFSSMLQMTDIRTPNDFTSKFNVTVDDGFWIAVNEPANIDTKIFNDHSSDTTGLFGNLSIQGATTYQSNSCSNFYKATPNIMRLFYTDAGGGGHTFQLGFNACSGQTAFAPMNLSLTCEPRAPFLTYEVSSVDSTFEELRNPGIFGQFLGLSGLEYHMRSEERAGVPGNKPFVRLNSASSCINMPNIAFQSWGTITVAFRLQTMPVKETLINFWSGAYYYNVILTPQNGSSAAVSVEHNFGGNTTTTTTGYTLSLNKWYLIFVASKATGFDLYINGIDELIANHGGAMVTSINSNGQLWTQNATWNPAPGQPQAACNIMIGTNGYMTWRGMYSTSSFNYDIAWIHFFDHYTNGDDIYRDCMANWIYTQFPDSLNTYKTVAN